MNRVRILAGDRPVRAVNEEIRAALAAGADVDVVDARSRHNLGVGLAAGARVRFEGSVGYYCGGLNNGASIEVERNAGWGAAEAMARGEVTVGGYAGMAAGASMRGGLLHVRGDAGPRCGVALKGGDILVEGRIGYLAGFMAHAGRIIALGGADDACGDSPLGRRSLAGGPAPFPRRRFDDGGARAGGGGFDRGAARRPRRPAGAPRLAEGRLRPAAVAFREQGRQRMADDLSGAEAFPFAPPSEEAVAMRDGAVEGRPAGSPDSYDEGGSPRWSPKAIADVHAMSQLGRYQLRGFSTFNRRMPSFDDLAFVPATMTRLPLEGYRESCETATVLGDRPGLVSNPIRLDIPIYVASMSFGALSAPAKAALGYGASKVGSMTCTGEGGMLEDEREASSTLVYQMTPSRYMLDLEHLRKADGIELAVGQGAKPGTGGVLLGMKVSERVARMRSLPVGVDQRSTVRHPDFLGADDMQVKIEELREATGYRVPIFLKMGATRPRYDVAIGAKAGADVIVLDGAEGGTGASPEILLDHTGIPTISAIRAAREALDECGKSDEVSLVAAGGIRNGTDAAKCLALGADAVMIGTAAMMALGCNSPRYLADYEALGTSPGRCHHCHTGRCPVGITTQEPELESRVDVAAAAERVARFLTAMTMEITLLAKSCGKSSVHNLELEDLRALSLEASAFTGAPLAGIDRPFTW